MLCHGILHDGSRLCIGGYGADEYVHHCFSYCDWFGEIWDLVLNWFRIYSILSNYASKASTMEKKKIHFWVLKRVSRVHITYL